MIELSSIIGKSVILLNDCEILGEIADVLTDEKCKKIEYFIINGVSENLEDAARRRAVPFSDILSISDAVTLPDGVGAIRLSDIDPTIYVSGLFEKPVYTRNGAFKGLIREIVCLDNGRIRSLIADNGKYKPEDIGGVGDIVILKGEKQPRAKRKMPSPAQDKKVTLLKDADTNDLYAAEKRELPVDSISQSSARLTEPAEIYELAENKTDESDNAAAQKEISSATEIKSGNIINATEETRETEAADDKEKAENGEKINASYIEKEPIGLKEIMDMIEASSYETEDDPHIPARVICDYGFLLDRVLAFDLDSYTGENIAPAGETITPELVEKARRAGKLVELTLNSRP